MEVTVNAWKAVGIAGALFLLAAASCNRGGKSEQQDSSAAEEAEMPAQASARGVIPAVQRTAAPALRSRSISGSTWDLADHRGKVVLVDFWATWCPPCRKTIPHMIELKNELGERGLEVVGISLDQGGDALVTQFVQQSGINYPIVVDGSGTFANKFGGVEGIPTFFIIDKRGRIAVRQQGAGPKETIQAAVESLLGES
jgi:cytochrome c biogenesis protein CcmG/thiol:disulfide interchange protein DsbE